MLKANKFIIILILIVVILFTTYIYNFITKTDVPVRNEFFDNKKQIIISFTTSPSRISKIKPVIDNLMNQSIVPSEIIINLPHIFKRTNETFNVIPEFITSNKLIKINKCEDIGPATKILPTSHLYSDPETIIISIDDDTLYKTDMIKNMLYYSDMFPDAVITGSSNSNKINKPDIIKNKNIPEDIHFAEFLEGFAGVLYKKKFLDIININNEYTKNLPNYCFNADDFIISNYLTKNNIPIVVIKIDKTFDRDLEHGTGNDALHNGAAANVSDSIIVNTNTNNYYKCADYMNNINDLHIQQYRK